MGEVEPLSPNHLLDQFDCGEERMNKWLRESALEAERKNTARTFVVCQGRRVIAYYAIAAGSVRAPKLPVEFGEMPKHPIPIFLLARLAVDRSLQGMGFGRALVRDAVIRSLAANREVAGVCLMVEVLSQNVRDFYQGLGFLDSPLSSNQMFLLLSLD